MLALVGLMLLSATLEANGAFRAAAHAIARSARGDGRRLFVGLALLTAGAATLLANDGAILILRRSSPSSPRRSPSPRRRRWPTCSPSASLRRAVDAVADVEPDQHPHGRHAQPERRLVLRAHAPADAGAVRRRHVGPVGDLGGDLPRRFDPAALGAPPAFSRGSWRATWTALALLALGYAVASFVRLPLGVVVLAVGGGLLAWETLRDAVDAPALLGRQPWAIVVFAVALFVVIYGFANAGAARWVAELLDPGGRALIPALVIAGVSVALLSGVTNNLPVFLVALLALRHLGILTHDARPATLPYAALVGANVGSKLTPVGSLATLLWLDMLRRRGLHVSWGRYTRLAALPTAAAVVTALVALAVTERLIH